MTGTGRKELGEAPWGAEPAGLRLQKQVEKCKHLPEHPHAAQTSCESTGDRRRVLGWHHQHQGGTATCHSPTASPRPVTPNTPRRCCEAWHEQVPGWPRVSVPPRGHNCLWLHRVATVFWEQEARSGSRTGGSTRRCTAPRASSKASAHKPRQPGPAAPKIHGTHLSGLSLCKREKKK